MNKPIRTVSIFCLLLFLALALNATYLQFFHADALNDRVGNGRVATATFSRERGAILAGRVPIAESVPSKDQYKFQRVYPKPLHVRPGHRLVHVRQRDRHRAGRELLPLRRGRPAVRQPPGRPGQRQRHQGRQRRADHQPGGAEGGLRRAAALGHDVQGAVVALEPTHRQDPGDGVAADVRPQQAGRPRLQEGQRLRHATCRSGPATRCSNRAIQSTLPARLDVQAGHRGRRGPERQRTPGLAGAGRARATGCRSRPTWCTTRSPGLRQRRQDHLHAGARVLLQHQLRPARPSSVGADGDAQDRPRGSGSTRPYLDDLPGQAVSLYPSGIDHAADRAVGLRPVRSRPRRCRWRWSPPASPTAAT